MIPQPPPHRLAAFPFLTALQISDSDPRGPRRPRKAPESSHTPTPARISHDAFRGGGGGHKVSGARPLTAFHQSESRSRQRSSVTTNPKTELNKLHMDAWTDSKLTRNAGAQQKDSSGKFMAVAFYRQVVSSQFLSWRLCDITPSFPPPRCCQCSDWTLQISSLLLPPLPLSVPKRVLLSFLLVNSLAISATMND